jgi:hypothetical protein
MVNNSNNEQYSEQETARRRDAVIKRMLNTPPQPHKPLKSMPRKGTVAQSKKRRKTKVT